MGYEDALAYWINNLEERPNWQPVSRELQSNKLLNQGKPSSIPSDRNLPKVVLTDIVDELENPTEPSYLVDGLIEDCTTGDMFGESTGGKSFAAVSLACSVATGTDWMGHRVNRKGSVIYFAGEGAAGIGRRFRAWGSYHQKDFSLKTLYLVKQPIEFNQTGAAVVAEEIEKTQTVPALIIIDTMVRSLPSDADENSAKDMMAFFNIIDSLRNRLNCVICLVHHTGHGEESKKRARGSSAIRAALDWEILVDKKKSQLCWTKMKDAEIPDSISFEIVSTGKSAVIKYGEMAEGKSKTSLSKSQKLGLETFKAACSKHNCDSVDLEQWRDEFYSSYSEKNPDAKEGANRTSFNRVKNGLISNCIITEEQGLYQLTESSVTNRNNVTPVTEDKRNERNTPLRGVTVVTSSEAPLPKIDLSLSQLGIQT